MLPFATTGAAGARTSLWDQPPMTEASTIWYSRARVNLKKHRGRWDKTAPPLSRTRPTGILKPLRLDVSLAVGICAALLVRQLRG
jgi:hypothetical protein